MIRAAQKTDLDRLAIMEMLLFDNALSPHQLEKELTAGEGIVFGDPLHAYALFRQEGRLIDLLRLGVEPAYRQQGLGGRLLERVLAKGLPVILTVKKDNWRAFRLYRKHAFAVVSHHPQAGSWVMRWDPTTAST